MRFSSLGGKDLVAVTAVNEAVLDKRVGYTSRRLLNSNIQYYQFG